MKLNICFRHEIDEQTIDKSDKHNIIILQPGPVLKCICNSINVS